MPNTRSTERAFILTIHTSVCNLVFSLTHSFIYAISIVMPARLLTCLLSWHHIPERRRARVMQKDEWDQNQFASVYLENFIHSCADILMCWCCLALMWVRAHIVPGGNWSSRRCHVSCCAASQTKPINIHIVAHANWFNIPIHAWLRGKENQFENDMLNTNIHDPISISIIFRLLIRPQPAMGNTNRAHRRNMKAFEWNTPMIQSAKREWMFQQYGFLIDINQFEMGG